MGTSYFVWTLSGQRTDWQTDRQIDNVLCYLGVIKHEKEVNISEYDLPRIEGIKYNIN